MKSQPHHLWQKIGISAIMSIALFSINTNVTHAATLTLPHGYLISLEFS